MTFIKKVIPFVCLCSMLAAQPADQRLTARVLDTDSDGSVSALELAQAAVSISQLDGNSDGLIDQVELGGPGPYFGWLRVQTTVRIIDSNGDCMLSAGELLNASEKLKCLDINGDGVLSEMEMFDKKRAGTSDSPSRFNIMINWPKAKNQIPPGADQRAYNGYLFYTESSVSGGLQEARGTYLRDAAGNLLHHWPSMRPSTDGSSAYLLENGLLLRQTAPDNWLTMDPFPIGSHGVVELVDWNGNIVYEYTRLESGAHALHHDMEPMPNGNILVISYEAMQPDRIRTLGGSSTGMIWTESILELKPDIDKGTTEIVWQWNAADHMTAHQNASSFTDRMDIDYGGGSSSVSGAHRQLHFNSIDYDAEYDQIIVSSLIMGEIYIIDHSTTTEEAAAGKGGRYGKGGRLLYRWGNPAAWGGGSADDRILSGQHDARWLDDDVPHRGDITIHNNKAGLLPDPPEQKLPFGLSAYYTKALEVRLPRQADGSFKSVTAEADIVWDYTPRPLESWFAPFMSCVSRLPNGNTLMVNSFNKRIFEVTAEGEMVLNYHIDGPGRIFRVYKLPKNYPGLAGRFLQTCPVTAE